MSSDNTEYLNQFEQNLHKNMSTWLRERDLVDKMMPVLTDIEEKWESIVGSYLPDGVREYQQYPTVSLGWMMYVGMAIAQYWDDDWALYSGVEDLYRHLRDKRGYDCMDEAIRQEILGLQEPAYGQCESNVRHCAQLAMSMLQHEQIEPGTPLAFYAYSRCLHQLYVMGAAMQLYALGYRMTAS